MDWKALFNAFSAFLGEKLDAIANKESRSLQEISATLQEMATRTQKMSVEGAELVTIKGEKGDAGHSPSDAELLALIRPLIPEPIKGDKGDAPTEQEILRILKPLIPKDGHTPTVSELTALIRPLIPQVKDGYTPRKGVDYFDGKPGEPGSPDTGEDIVKKINKDKSGKVIKKEHLEGWDELENRVRTAEANSGWRGGGSFVYDYDYSSLLDGVTKTFTLPPNAHVIAVLGSSTPGIFRKTVDYTTTASTITFTGQIDETTTLALGQTLILLYKIL